MVNKVLLIIDMQNDFCPGGALAVPDGDQIVPVINKIINKFDKVVATQDWHPKNHISFASTHNKNVGETISIKDKLQVLWPDHCVQGTYGAQLHPELNTEKIALILRKGMNPEIDSYSAFLENDQKTETGLHYWFKGLGINEIYICGLALDYCVYYSACDAVKFGFKTFVIIDATKGVDIPKGNIDRAVAHMSSLGIELISYESL
ncbi:MAG: bifunctional nicotinamidase/pyrazinamidase [Endomicrobia bacterium]|nr:bifunctional nicotinamidase/pyrazinamidase [Endomicrobiia bacterium]